jgi:hypothetical protein
MQPLEPLTPHHGQLFESLRSLRAQHEAQHEATKIASIRGHLASFDPCPDRDFLLGFSDEHLVASYEWLESTLPRHGISLRENVDEQSFLRTLKWMMVDCQGPEATQYPSEAKLMEVYRRILTNDQEE